MGLQSSRRRAGALTVAPLMKAYGDAETREKVRAAGAVGLITKPIDFAVLKAEIDRRLSAFAGTE